MITVLLSFFFIGGSIDESEDMNSDPSSINPFIEDIFYFNQKNMNFLSAIRNEHCLFHNPSFPVKPSSPQEAMVTLAALAVASAAPNPAPTTVQNPLLPISRTKAFIYDRASPSGRWPALFPPGSDQHPEDPWIALSQEDDPCTPPHHRDDDDGDDDGDDERATASKFKPLIISNPYVAAHGKSHASLASQSSFVSGMVREPKNGRLIRLSKLALRKAKDWRERVERLSRAICDLTVRDSVADLLKDWSEQLSPTDMCFVVKNVGDSDWRRALELYEWYNRQHWYEPHGRMLAGILSVLGRAHQSHLAKEIFDRAVPNLGNCVQVYNAMMGVYARKGDITSVQKLLALMKENGCSRDLITYNTVINARCKAGLMPGMAIQLLKDMKKDRLTPDVVTYNTLLSACASRNDADEAEKIFANMKTYQCEPDLWTYNAMISLYGRIPGREATAIDYFEFIQTSGLVPDAVTYNSILYAFAKIKRVDDVEKIRMHMKQNECKADEITYNTMISMYGKLGSHDKALSLYQEMKGEGCHPDAVTFTVLIDALGKAERVEEAENVFQEMADLHITPTLQGFSAMINAYVKVQKFAEAQCSYECMVETGIIPDNLIFSLILDVLQKLDLPKEGIQMYQRAVKRGFVPELHVYRALLSWLSGKGLWKDIEVVSNDLALSGFACHEVCDIFIEVNLPDKAAEHLTNSASQGLSVSEKSILDILNGFGTLAKYHEAQSFVECLDSLLPELVFMMREALILVLAEFKQVSAVLDELKKVRKCSKPLNLSTYQTLIAMFYDAGLLDQVILMAMDLQSFGIDPDERCMTYIHSAYASPQGSVYESLDSPQIEVMPDSKLTLDSYIARIESYGKQHLWQKAERSFQMMQEAGHKPSLKAWNTLISSYAISGEYENARCAFSAMVTDGKMPTSCTCNALLQAVINAKRPHDICGILQEMRQYGVNPGKDVFLAILESSSNKGKIQIAKAAFQEIRSAGYLPNMQVYKSMILLFTRVKRAKDAEDMLKNMELDGFSPDIDIYNAMIKLYGKLGHYKKGTEVFIAMQEAGCSPDMDSFNSLIWIYSKCLKIQEALAIVRQMGKAGFVPDADSYTALIAACGRLNMQEAAEVVFKDAYESDCKLNYKVFHAMMGIYRKAGQPEQVKRILDQMATAKIAPTLGTFHLLMDSYGKGGDPNKAEAVLNVMQEAGFLPGPLQYAGVISAYLSNKDHSQAIEKLLSMKSEGFEPDYMLWTSLVGAASHCQESGDAIRLLHALANVGFSLPLRLLTENSLSLISEFDQILEELDGSGPNAGLGFTNVLLDLLWAFQMRATALRVFTTALERKIYPATIMRVQQKDWCADLRRLSAGAALVALTVWLEQMQDAALQGFPEYPRIVTLVTGCNLSTRNLTSVQQTVKVHLWTMGSPFLKSESRSGLFEAKGYSICQWLKDSPHCMDLKLRNFTILPQKNAMQMHGGAFMQASLVPGLKEIEESVGNLSPKKFRRLIHMTQLKRRQVIVAELEAREQMKTSGRVNLKRQRKAKFRKKLHRVQK